MYEFIKTETGWKVFWGPLPKDCEPAAQGPEKNDANPPRGEASLPDSASSAA